MNLFYMIERGDRNLVIEGEVAPAKRLEGENTWRGLDLRRGSAFTIPDVRRFVSFRAFPDSCGWMVKADRWLGLRLSFHACGTGAELSARVFTRGFQPLTLPWPKGEFGCVDLRAEVVGKGRGRVFVANHRALSRQWLIDMARGSGVEIGPGPQPQILPREGVDVSYVEQMPPAEWNELYNPTGKFPVRPELWKNYVVGEAAALPFADHSLDFIFGSHVFEHLANPIGHLELWKQKLAPGGKVICVVPDLAGTKDAVQQRSTLEEWLEEHAQNVWSPTERHYVRHFRRPADHHAVSEAIALQKSIHAHYYDNINCQQLLDHAVRHLGYADYLIEHTPNHKDFHFVLRNA